MSRPERDLSSDIERRRGDLWRELDFIRAEGHCPSGFSAAPRTFVGSRFSFALVYKHATKAPQSA